MRRFLVTVGLLVLCCCQTAGGGQCCAQVSFCGGFIPGCLCSPSARCGTAEAP